MCSINYYFSKIYFWKDWSWVKSMEVYHKRLQQYYHWHSYRRFRKNLIFMVNYSKYSFGKRIPHPRVSPNSSVNHKTIIRIKTIATQYSFQLNIEKTKVTWHKNFHTTKWISYTIKNSFSSKMFIQKCFLENR